MKYTSNLFDIGNLRADARVAYLLRAFLFIWRTNPLQTIAAILLKIVSALYPIAFLYLTKYIIDGVSGLVQNKTDSARINEIFFYVSIFIAMLLLQNVISVLQNSIHSLLQYRVEQNVSLSIMKKCSEMDMVFFETPEYLNILENAKTGSSGQFYSVISLFLDFVETLIMFFSFIFIFSGLHWLAAAIVIGSTLPQILVDNYFAKKRWEIETNLAEPRRMRGFFSSVMTQRGPAKEIRLFGLFNIFLDRYRYFTDRFIGIEKSFVLKRSGASLFIGLFTTAGIAAVWIYIVRRATTAAISVGDVVLYTGAVTNCQSSLSSLFSHGSNLFRQALFLGNYFRLLDLDPSSIQGALNKTPADTRSPMRHAPFALKEGIEFRNVSFRYPGTDELVLKNINFFLRPEESVAIVGKNGAGKTTLVKLLIRLYDPTEGQILLDGNNASEYDLGDLRRMFSVVFQDYLCYPLTARENIGFGRVELINDELSIQRAAKRAGAHGFIERLPRGYESFLGRAFQGSGVDLSIGQWQKIALARALLRDDSPVLILDEPTAALDVFAEHELYSTFGEMMSNRLSIIISHRFSTVRAANRILVLDEGCLVEQGTHEELLNRREHYEEMYSLQAERYR